LAGTMRSGDKCSHGGLRDGNIDVRGFDDHRAVFLSSLLRLKQHETI
jgi:hypothetical protein